MILVEFNFHAFGMTYYPSHIRIRKLLSLLLGRIATVPKLSQKTVIVTLDTHDAYLGRETTFRVYFRCPYGTPTLIVTKSILWPLLIRELPFKGYNEFPIEVAEKFLEYLK